MWRFSSFAALVAVAALGLVPTALGSQADERSRPVMTARVVVPATAFGAPRRGAKPIMRLQGATTWTGTAQRLMVTGRHRDADGRRWVRVQLPIRPNQAAGWVRADRMRLSTTRIRFEVHLASRRLEIWRGAHRIASWPAGIGRPGTPTPVGRFAIQDPVPTLPSWISVFGAYTLTLTAHSPTLLSFMGGDGLVAIHGTGTGRGWRVGAVSSNGCVILGERQLAVAARYARAGTPVVIDRS